MAEAILGIGLLVFLSLFFTALFQKTRVPDVLLLVLIGLVLGPALHLVQPDDFGEVGHVMSEIALIVILFESGTTLDIDVLRKLLRVTLTLTLVTFTITTAIVALAGVYVLGLEVRLAILLGLILGSISPAVVIPLARTVKMKEPAMTLVILESGLADVLSIVLVFSMLDAAQGDFKPVRLVGSVFSSLVNAGIIGLLGAVAWLVVLNAVRQFPNTAFATFAFVFIIFGIADLLGFSGAIATLAFGFGMTNYDRFPIHDLKFFKQRKLGEVTEADKEFFHEIIFLLKTFFFVYLGLNIHFDNPVYLAIALALVLIVLVIRAVIVRVAVGGTSPGWEESFLLTIMTPKGLAAAVLASVPLERGLANGELIRNFSYIMVLVSVVVTAVLVPAMARPAIGRWSARILLPEPTGPKPLGSKLD